jgi:hypothetical protein
MYAIGYDEVKICRKVIVTVALIKRAFLFDPNRFQRIICIGFHFLLKMIENTSNETIATSSSCSNVVTTSFLLFYVIAVSIVNRNLHKYTYFFVFNFDVKFQFWRSRLNKSNEAHDSKFNSSKSS